MLESWFIGLSNEFKISSEKQEAICDRLTRLELGKNGVEGPSYLSSGARKYLYGLFFSLSLTVHLSLPPQLSLLMVWLLR